MGIPSFLLLFWAMKYSVQIGWTVSGDLLQRLYSVWWYIMFVTSNT